MIYLNNALAKTKSFPVTQDASENPLEIMKRLLLPLLAASSVFSVFAPQAEAGAIASDSRGLNPRLFGPGSFGRARAGFVPAGAIKLPQLSNLGRDLATTLTGNSISDVGSVTKTGAGTLTLNGPFGYSGGSILTMVGAQDPGVGQTLDTLNITDGAVVVLFIPPTAAVVRQWSSIDPATALAWASGIDRRDLALQNSSGTIQIGIRELAPSGGATSVADAASAPVPEPTSAILLVIGALAVSQSRRGRES